jgi:hypothetical protein
MIQLRKYNSKVINEENLIRFCGTRKKSGQPSLKTPRVSSETNPRSEDSKIFASVKLEEVIRVRKLERSHFNDENRIESTVRAHVKETNISQNLEFDN